MQLKPAKFFLSAFFLCFFALGSLRAQITAVPAQGCAPLVGVQFTGLTGATNIAWTFGDGSTAGINNPVHTFVSAGTYNVTYTATVSGAPVSQSVPVKVFGKPTPNFVYSSPANGCVPLSVTFTDQSTGGGGAAITGWQWSFGDGGISAVQNPNYSFSIGGQFDVTLIVTDANGCDSAITKTDVVTVSPKPFVIIKPLSNPITSCTVPFSVNFDGSLSSTNSPIGGGLTYAWNFGNGSNSVLAIPTATTYTAVGDYTVSLVCTDNNNCSQTAVTTVSIIQPLVEAIVIDSICKGASFSIRDSSDADGTVWNFGDGTPTVSNTIFPSNIPHTYSTAGTYTITGTATTGVCTNVKTYVIVVDEAIAQYTTAMPHYSCNPVYPVTYTNQSTGGHTYNWSFSNGNTSTLQNPTNIFTQNSLNEYTIFDNLPLTATLTAISALGCWDTVIHSLDSIHRPTAFFYTDGREGCSPLTITFTDSSFSHENIVSYEWHFGDGTPNVSGPNDTIVTHTFNTPGVDTTYLVILNANGCRDTSFFYPITSVIPPDINFSFSPSVVCPQDAVVIDNLTDPADSVNHWHVISDGTYFSGCVNDSTPSWNYNHTGVHDITMVGYTHSCRSDTTLPTQVTVKGPIVSGRFHTQCGDDAYKVMFDAFLQDADSAFWNYGDGGKDTVIGNGAHTTYHTYTASGDYTATLTGVNSTSGCIPFVITLNVTVRKIDANFANAAIVCHQVPSSYDASGSVDVLASCGIGYTWYFDNAPPVVTENAILPYGLPQGVHSIKLIVKDANGCRDTTTGTVNVSKVTAAFALNDTIGCLPSFSVSTIQQSTTTSDATITGYSWTFGDLSGTFTGATETHIYSAANAPSQNYVVSLTVTNSNGCVDNHTITATVNAPSCTISTNSLAFICSGKTVTFGCTPSPGITPVNYAWNFGDGSPVQNTALPTVNHPFAPGGTYTVSVGVIDGAGCQGMSVNTNTVQVQDYPQAGFQFVNQCDSTKAVACAGCGIAFTDTSINAFPGPRQWNLGTGGPIVGSQTVGTTYTAVGDYPISLVVSTTFGCRDTILDTIHVLGASADFTMDKNAICKSESIVFTVSNPVNVATWHWDFGDGVEDVAVSPISHAYNYHPPGGTTNATLIYWTPDSACRYTVVKPINIYQVIADFDRNNEALEIDSIHCLGTQDLFTNTSLNANTYAWNLGDGTTSAALSPTHTYAATGTYTVTLHITDNVHGCKDTLKKPMVIVAPPVAIVTGGSVCAGMTDTITASGLSSYTYLWQPDSLLLDPTVASPQTLSLTQTTTFTVVVTDTIGCATTYTTNVTVQQAPLHIEWDTTVIIGQTIPIPGNAGLNMIYNWTPTTDLSCTTCSNPTSFSLVDIVYTTDVTDLNSCFSTVNTFTIKIIPKATVDVPTAFTPDGDGTNDVIYVDGWGIKKLIYFRIYNRWGQLLFESTDLKTGWDGYYNGVLQNMETYVYQASAQTYTDVAPVEIKGSFKLIR